MVRLGLAKLALLAAAGSAPNPGEVPMPGGAGDPTPVPSSGAPLEAPGPEPATLAALRERPTAWLGRPARVTVQLRGRVEGFWNPGLSRFGPGAYARYEAWSDEALLWRRADWDDAAPWLFARRGSAAADALAAARSHDRLELDLRVLEVFLGEPWIEVEAVRPLPARVGEGTILHATRALELRAQGLTELALEQLERALAPALPAPARTELERLRAAWR